MFTNAIFLKQCECMEYLLEVSVQVKVDREGKATSHLVGLISARLTKANYNSRIKSESVREMGT